MIKAVIFDLDNTLIDFMHMKNQAVKAAVVGMIETGLKVPFDEAKEKIYNIYDQQGYEYQEVLNQFIKGECNKIDYKILAAGIVSYRKAKEEALIAYPNSNKTLIDISKLGLKLGLITDAPKREAWTRLYSVNFHNIFDRVVTFDDTGHKKPSKIPFEMILNHFKIKPHESIMVGDWPEKDIYGAMRVGMRTAFAKYGNQSSGHKKVNADVVLNDISEIVKYVKTINQK